MSTDPNPFVTLVVKVVDGEPIKKRARREVLWSESTYFQEKLKEPVASTSGETEIEVPLNDPNNLMAMYRFMFEGTFELDESNAASLWRDASALRIENLQRKCLLYMVDKIDRDNWCKRLKFSRQEGCEELKAGVLDYVERNFILCLSDDMLTTLSKDELVSILRLPGRSKCSSEVLFRRVLRWIKEDEGHRAQHAVSLWEELVPSRHRSPSVSQNSHEEPPQMVSQLAGNSNGSDVPRDMNSEAGTDRSSPGHVDSTGMNPQPAESSDESRAKNGGGSTGRDTLRDVDPCGGNTVLARSSNESAISNTVAVSTGGDSPRAPLQQLALNGGGTESMSIAGTSSENPTHDRRPSSSTSKRSYAVDSSSDGHQTNGSKRKKAAIFSRPVTCGHLVFKVEPSAERKQILYWRIENGPLGQSRTLMSTDLVSESIPLARLQVFKAGRNYFDLVWAPKLQRVYFVGNFTTGQSSGTETYYLQKDAPDCWISGPTLKNPMKAAKVITYQQKVYVLGSTLKDQTWYSAVEVLSDKRNCWKEAKLPQQRQFHLGFQTVVLHDKIYMVGGLKCDYETKKFSQLKSVEYFCPKKREWRDAAAMNTARFCHSVVTMGSKLFALGGMAYRKGVTPEGLKSAEVYDLNTNSWSPISEMNRPRANGSAIALNGKIYAIGGDMSVAEKSLSSVEVYDPEMDEWTLWKECLDLHGVFETVAVIDDPSQFFSRP